MFAEDRFLHQVRERHGGSRLLERDDLPDALGGARPLPGRSPWRIHFHVPVHADLQYPLQSTREELAAALAVLVGLIRLLIGWSRSGYLAYFMSDPVVVGFTAGAAGRFTEQLRMGFEALRTDAAERQGGSAAP